MTPDSSVPTTVITPSSHTSILQVMQDLWSYRDLLWAMIERDIKIRYKQTALGVLWVILQPLLFAAAFAWAFARPFKLNQEQMPAFLFYFAGLLVWIIFSNGLNKSTSSIEENRSLVSKVYFPRLIVPSAAILGTLVDYIICWIMLNIFVVAYSMVTHFEWISQLPLISRLIEGLPPVTWTPWLILMTPFLLLIQLMAMIGISAFLTITHARYRDVKAIIPTLILFGMFVSPVPYSYYAQDLPGFFRTFLFFNPLSGIIQGYRDSIGPNPFNWPLIASSAAVSMLLFYFGLKYFINREKDIVDVL